MSQSRESKNRRWSSRRSTPCSTSGIMWRLNAFGRPTTSSTVRTSSLAAKEMGALGAGLPQTLCALPTMSWPNTGMSCRTRRLARSRRVACLCLVIASRNDRGNTRRQPSKTKRRTLRSSLKRPLWVKSRHPSAEGLRPLSAISRPRYLSSTLRSLNKTRHPPHKGECL